MNNYIDTTNASLGIGLITLIVVFILCKYLLSSYWSSYKEEELSDTQTIMYSAILAVILALIMMIGYKQALIYRGKRSMLTDDFFE